MNKEVQVKRLPIGDTALQTASPRLRNQLAWCMHVQNELAVLCRIHMFSTNAARKNDLAGRAQSIQTWCIMQLLAAKLFETWVMLNERFIKADPEDAALTSLTGKARSGLDWLKDYFGVGDKLNNSVLRTIRDKTAFHYTRGST